MGAVKTDSMSAPAPPYSKSDPSQMKWQPDVIPTFKWGKEFWSPGEDAGGMFSENAPSAAVKTDSPVKGPLS